MAKKKNQKNKNSKTKKSGNLDKQNGIKEELKIEVSENKTKNNFDENTEEKVETDNKIIIQENLEIDESEDVNNTGNQNAERIEKIEMDEEIKEDITAEPKKVFQEEARTGNVAVLTKEESPQENVKIVEKVVEKIIIKEVEPKKKNIFIRMISFVFSRMMFLIFMIFVFLISIQSAIYVFDKKANESVFEEVSKTFVQKVVNEEGKETGPFIDFAKLQEKNQETVGWLKVNNINVDLPIVRGTDNEFYLSHNYYKALNSEGWIFVDSSNRLDGTDKNVVIYGKNRIDGASLGTLKKVLKDEWLYNNSSKTISFITPTEMATYEVFSVYKTKYEDDFTKTVFSEGEFEKFIENVKSRSIKDFGTNVANTDSIMTICTTVSKEGRDRFVLHAKKVVGE